MSRVENGDLQTTWSANPERLKQLGLDLCPRGQENIFWKTGDVAKDVICQGHSVLELWLTFLIIKPCGKNFGECTANVYIGIYKIHMCTTMLIYYVHY